MTHLLQPLDLTFFSSLTSELKSIVWNWHGEVANAGQTLNKYSVVVLLQKATEKCLDKDGIISNGFRRAGLTPWDTTAPDVSKILHRAIFHQPPKTTPSQKTTIWSTATPPLKTFCQIAKFQFRHNENKIVIFTFEYDWIIFSTIV